MVAALQILITNSDAALNMNSVIQTYDIVMLVVLLGAAIFGAWKGMVWQMASLASLLVSAAVAIHFSTPLRAVLQRYRTVESLFGHAGALYLVRPWRFGCCFRMVSGIVNRVKLREFDRQMGALFGLAKGVLFAW